MNLDFNAWFDLSRCSKVGHKWPFFFHERQISKKQSIPPLVSGLLGEERGLRWVFVTHTLMALSRSRSSKSFLIGQFEIAATLFLNYFSGNFEAALLLGNSFGKIPIYNSSACHKIREGNGISHVFCWIHENFC